MTDGPPPVKDKKARAEWFERTNRAEIRKLSWLLRDAATAVDALIASPEAQERMAQDTLDMLIVVYGRTHAHATRLEGWLSKKRES
jgi:hypothetical protein